MAAADSEYRLKVIQFPDSSAGRLKDMNIITQNRNGPCPLISICNALILKKEINLRQELQTISFEDLVEILGNLLMEQNPVESTEKVYNTVQHVLNMFGKLQVGLDVNIGFGSIHDFESSKDLAVFEVFGVDLVHGWTVDPLDKETFRVAVQQCVYYNQLIELVVQCQAKELEDQKRLDGLIASEFLENSITQMTFHGLQSLYEGLVQDQFQGKLYTLVTDEGYAATFGVVWESLDSLDGDSVFYDSSFKKFSPEILMAAPSTEEDNHPTQIHSTNHNLSHSLALELQGQETRASQVSLESTQTSRKKKEKCKIM